MRITVEKDEAVADLIERILEVHDREIILVIPKGSRLTDSPSNFRLIAREGGVLGKEISVESVDQEVLSHAKTALALQPATPCSTTARRAAKRRHSPDIVPRGAKKKLPVGKKLAPEPEPEPEPEEEELDEEEEEEQDEDEVLALVEADEVEEAEETDRLDRDERYDTLDEPSSGRGKKIFAWILVILLLIGGGMWLTAYAFGAECGYRHSRPRRGTIPAPFPPRYRRKEWMRITASSRPSSPRRRRPSSIPSRPPARALAARRPRPLSPS